MKQKIFQVICIVLFFVVFGYFYGEQYWEHQEKYENKNSYEALIAQEMERFSFDTFDSNSEIVALHSTPSIQLLDDIVNQLENAQEYIYVEVYIFTEKRMRDALIAAHKRGVEVKILLENNPYQAPYLNDNHYNDFLDASLDVRWSDPLNYSLNHSKLLIIDSRAYISTGNFSYSLFTKNRDLLVEISQGALLEVLKQLFVQDFMHERLGVYHPSLVLSPDYSREKLSLLIQQTKESLDIYFPYLQDELFENLIFSAAENNITINLIVDKVFYDENPERISEYREKGINIRYLGGKKLHAKSILSDKKYLYIGSVNFSTYSFDENREVGLLISNEGIIGSYKQIFNQDLMTN